MKNLDNRVLEGFSSLMLPNMASRECAIKFLKYTQRKGIDLEECSIMTIKNDFVIFEKEDYKMVYNAKLDDVVISSKFLNHYGNSNFDESAFIVINRDFTIYKSGKTVSADMAEYINFNDNEAIIYLDSDSNLYYWGFKYDVPVLLGKQDYLDNYKKDKVSVIMLIDNLGGMNLISTANIHEAPLCSITIPESSYIEYIYEDKDRNELAVIYKEDNIYYVKNSKMKLCLGDSYVDILKDYVLVCNNKTNKVSVILTESIYDKIDIREIELPDNFVIDFTKNFDKDNTIKITDNCDLDLDLNIDIYLTKEFLCSLHEDNLMQDYIQCMVNSKLYSNVENKQDSLLELYDDGIYNCLPVVSNDNYKVVTNSDSLLNIVRDGKFLLPKYYTEGSNATVYNEKGELEEYAFLKDTVRGELQLFNITSGETVECKYMYTFNDFICYTEKGSNKSYIIMPKFSKKYEIASDFRYTNDFDAFAVPGNVFILGIPTVDLHLHVYCITKSNVFDLGICDVEELEKSIDPFSFKSETGVIFKDINGNVVIQWGIKCKTLPYGNTVEYAKKNLRKIIKSMYIC